MFSQIAKWLNKVGVHSIRAYNLCCYIDHDSGNSHPIPERIYGVKVKMCSLSYSRFYCAFIFLLYFRRCLFCSASPVVCMHYALFSIGRHIAEPGLNISNLQTCTERQHRPADGAQILDSVVTSLHPCSQNLPFFREIQMCMGRIKTQILALFPTWHPPCPPLPSHIIISI